VNVNLEATNYTSLIPTLSITFAVAEAANRRQRTKCRIELGATPTKYFFEKNKKGKRLHTPVSTAWTSHVCNMDLFDVQGVCQIFTFEPTAAVVKDVNVES
jgi:hypothetical protein